MAKVGFRQVFASRRMAVLFALGFSSGLPLLLTGQTLSAWLTVEKVSLKTIGAFALVALSYNFKWVWAPVFDRYPLPFLGRRRGWMLALQLALAGAIAFMGTMDPGNAPFTLAVAAAVVAFLSASQDVVVDAHRTELLGDQERAAGSAVAVLGYRVALLVTGTLALALADRVAWTTIYTGLGALMVVGVVATLFAEEPHPPSSRPRTLVEAMWRPLSGLLFMRGAAFALSFVALFKVGETLLDSLKIPFLKLQGFTFTEIAFLNKALGFAGAAVGGLMAGVLVARMGVRRSLLAFGATMAATNLLYILLALGGRSYPLLAATIFIDNVAMMISSAAFMAYLMSLCDRRFTATQFALLSSLATLAARLLGPVGGATAESLGWPLFFVATTVAVVPALVLTFFIPVPKPAEPAVSAGEQAEPSRSTV